MTADTAAPALSFVIPVFNEEGNVERVHADVTRAARRTGLSYEIVFVNDGSTDATLARLERLLAWDATLRVVDLAGNFGESAGLSAGFAVARGDLVVTMDGDGQNDPTDLPRMLEALADDVDVVTGNRVRREEDFTTRVLPSRIANALIAWVTGVAVHDCGCSLKVYRRGLVAGLRLPRGMHRFLPGITGVPPQRIREVRVNDRPRGSGRSHYGLSRILIVLRDLVGLRLVLRPPRAGRGMARGLLAITVAGLGAAVWAASSDWPVLIVATLVAGAGAALAARHDVTRFLDAESTGVYRVRRILDGRSADSDRDRRPGLLGPEPAAHVRRPAVRTGDGAL